VNVNEKHSLPREYLGFEVFLERNFSKLDAAYLGIKMDIEKLFYNSTDVIIFLKLIYADVEAHPAHHFLI
jgi:hypothetical protein